MVNVQRYLLICKNNKKVMEHYNGRPINDVKRSEIEIRTYDFLDKIGVFYETICHEAVYTMGDCETVEKELGAPVCKNLFLCNRQQTQFYLLMLPNDKHFKTKSLSSELECPRLSFADEQHMIDLLGVHPGSVTPMGLMNDKENKVQLVIDKELLTSYKFFGCHPCANTATIKLSLQEFVEKFVPMTDHNYMIVTLKTE